MSAKSVKSVTAVEALMLRHFREEPFHNLFMIYERQEGAVPGGTCSDKTLSFVEDCRLAGFDVALHSGFIKGEEIHRLARLRIDGRDFFADVGNGWPSLHLYPADREVSYHCFGIGFRTEIRDGRVSVFYEKGGDEALQLEIDVRGRPESEIMEDIKNRFNSGMVYPFSDRLRFSRVVGDRFLFLRSDSLEIYSDNGFDVVEGIDEARVPAILKQYFGCETGPLVRRALERAGSAERPAGAAQSRNPEYDRIPEGGNDGGTGGASKSGLPRSGWGEAFARANAQAHRQEMLIDDTLANRFDKKEWRW